MKNESTILDSIPVSTAASERDFKRVTKINRWLLTLIGIWIPQNDTNLLQKILSNLTIIICYFLIFLLLIPCILHTFITETNTQIRIKMMGPISFCVMGILKYFFLTIRRKKICKCFNHIDIDWRRVEKPEDREIMINQSKIGHFIASLCATFSYSGGFFFRTILPFAVPRKVLPDNTTMRPLVYPVYQTFFDPQKTPIYEVIFTTQWLEGVVSFTIAVGSCSLFAVLTLHVCGQLKIVMSRLDDLVECNLNASRMLTIKLGEIVELHLRALQLVVQIEGIMTEICFVEMVGCTMNICLIGYYMIIELEQSKSSPIAIMTWLFLITSFTFSIFIYCHIGELLNQQGKKVGATAYMIDWYKLRGKSASDLILVLAMSNYSATITAGKMVELSYATFCNVLKTAMAYFNLLKSVIL